MTKYNPEYSRNYYIKNREKRQIYDKNWLSQNREKRLLYLKIKNKERLAKRRSAIDAIKLTLGCIDCGYKSHPEALDFDHVRGDKLFNIGTSHMYTMDDVLEEMSKCEVVCANCHRVRTNNRRSK